VQPQVAVAVRNNHDLLSEEDIDLFIRKVDALKAHLDSLHSKSDHREIKDESAQEQPPSCCLRCQRSFGVLPHHPRPPPQAF
jgi:hypothetical protein